jgi:uncharacterized protein YqhQ
MEDRLISYGGQALIEGVMMRGRTTCALAMRNPGGQIITKTEPLSGIYKTRIAKIPFLRGVILLWDALGLGMHALTESANNQTGENERLEGPVLVATLGLTFLLAIGIFYLTPAGVGWLTEKFLDWNAWWSNLLEGGLRLLMLILYLWVIGFMPEIRRVFSYHGAEHKTINAYEAGAKLTPEAVSKYSIEHPRCGTAFLLTLMVFSLFFFSILGPLPIVWRLISRLVMLPVLVGMAYEYIKWTSDHLSLPFVKLIVKPNLALQALTTREPDLSMVEVAIAAFQTMRVAEKNI